MATAGVKRSYFQMRYARVGEDNGIDSQQSREPARLDGAPGLSLPQSREQSPKVSSPFRAVSAAAEPAQKAHGSSTPVEPARHATFDPSASIVLVGLRGTGKSSLGVIAAAAYNYRLIESQRAFIDATGSSQTDYRASHGTEKYQRRNCDVLERMLTTYKERSVIIWSFSDLENGGGSLLQDHARGHPVIHVTRDAVGLHHYFKTWTLDRINQLLRASAEIIRPCSNFEFFNLTEQSQVPAPTAASKTHQRPHEAIGKHLTLKRVERDFLRLMRNVVGDHGRSIAHHSAYPLSQVKVEKRLHTYAVRLTTDDVLSGNLDLEAAQTGADCIELVLSRTESGYPSFHEIGHAFAIVRRNSILPIWVNATAGQFQSSKPNLTLRDILGFCLSLGPELCSVPVALDDNGICALNGSKASTRLIASWKSSRRPSRGWKDDECSDMYRRAAKLGLDLLKLTLPSGPTPEPFESRAFCAEMRQLGSGTDIIAYDRGSEGRASQCFNEILTSVQPAASDTSEPESAGSSSSLTAQSITNALFASFVLEPLRFYIYGRDVSYSLSPAMSNPAYAACGLRHELTTFNCNDLDGLHKLVRGADFGGAAILQPFKTAVMPMLDTISSHARAIGAVNTVVPIHALRSDGSMPDELEIHGQRNRRGPLLGLYGTNTDWIGIRSCVRRGLSPANSVRPASTGLICGAGGMARAAVHSLASMGCQNIFICNRTPENARKIAGHYNNLLVTDNIPELGTTNTSNTRVTVIDSFGEDWPSNMRQPTMIVCCIPADDTDGNFIDFTLPPAWLKSPTGGVVVEVAYKRPLTPLISQIRALAGQGWVLYDGFDVLPEQAYAQFEVFTGRRAPRRLMKDQVLKHYHAMTSAEETSV